MKLNWSFFINTALIMSLLTSAGLSAQGKEATNSAQNGSSESHGEMIAAATADSEESDQGFSSKHTKERELAFALLIIVVGLGYFYQRIKGLEAAQRRKKSLVEADGENRPILVEGSREFEQHCQMLADAWTKKLKAIGQPSELEGEKERRAKREEFNQWLHNYLNSYRDHEQELLVMRLLDPVYVELMVLELPQKKNQGRESALKWSVETLLLYKTVKPYLSDSSAMMYAKPLKCFYETVIRRKIDNSKDGKIIAKIKREFEQILEIEASKCY